MTSPALGITVIFNATSGLPWIIRTVEDNAVFGTSERDLQVYNYTSVDGIMFPQRFTTLYNNAVLEDLKYWTFQSTLSFPRTFSTACPPTARREVQQLGRLRQITVTQNLVNGPITCYTVANILGGSTIFQQHIQLRACQTSGAWSSRTRRRTPSSLSSLKMLS